MKRLEIPKAEPKTIIFQTKIDSETAKEAKRIADKNGFKMTDVLRSGIKMFIEQYSDKQVNKKC